MSASNERSRKVAGRKIGALRYEVTVSANGDILWLNGDDGLCWARFSKRFGIDVHRSVTMQDSASECLYCTHKKAGITDWAIFRAEVFQHHGAVIAAGALSFD